MKNNLSIPLAIVVAGALIAVAILIVSGNGWPLSVANVANTEESGESTENNDSGNPLDKIAPITEKDHIRGNPSASVKIVEFSDIECPFCKGFHSTMQQVINEYGIDSQVAWVYRHFPLDQLHQKARKEAEATECAAEIGGNNGFWTYIDRLFEITPSNDQLDLSLLPQIAEEVGLNRSEFEFCLESGRWSDKVATDLEDAINTGGQGTPWSVVIAPNGKKFSISGAQPYSVIKSVIDTALKEK